MALVLSPCPVTSVCGIGAAGALQVFQCSAPERSISPSVMVLSDFAVLDEVASWVFSLLLFCYSPGAAEEQENPSPAAKEQENPSPAAPSFSTLAFPRARGESSTFNLLS